MKVSKNMETVVSVPDLPDHDNAMKWKRSFAALSPVRKTVVGLLIAAACVGGIVSCNQSAKVEGLREELAAERRKLADYVPFKTAALVAYGKDDPASLKQLADSISTLRTNYTEARDEAAKLRSEVNRLRAQTERAVDAEAEEELVAQLKTFGK